MFLKNNMPPRRLVLKLFFSLLLFLLFDNVCTGSQWTMMFYMAADNDLFPQALIDIKELQNISGQPGVDIIVHLDSPSGAFRYRVLPHGISLLASLGKSNSGLSKTLSDFGNWAVESYPAKKYLLVLWDHGDGWSKQWKSIGIDGLDCLSVAGGELRQGVAEISTIAGQPLDIVIFDACNMQMAEVLMELGGSCRFAVGSEAPFPTEGMPYVAAWRGINGDISAESLAVRLVNSCSSYGDLGYQMTCSVVDVNSLSIAAQSLKAITGRLVHLPISTFINPSVVSDSVLSFLSWYSYDLPLALDFIGNRMPEPEKTLVLDASRQFKNSVLVQSIAGNDYQTANGLAAWYPKGKNNFEKGIESYRNLKWSVLSGWDKLLYQLIFQNDSTAPVPQDIILAQTAGGLRKLTWENGYDPSGVEKYQIRHSQKLIIDINDQGGRSDSSNWYKKGFILAPKMDGDTAYFSNDGQMTRKSVIRFDSTGNIGFSAEGINGTVILESSSDTNTSWETLGTWNYYSAPAKKYCSANVKSTTATIRISWNPFSSGWIYIDDIKVCHPDATQEIKTVSSPLPFYMLNNRPGEAGFYQVSSVDSLKNKSSWSDYIFCQPSASTVKIWPNPFKNRVFLFHSSSTETIQEVKIFNILGQLVDRMFMREKIVTGGTSEVLYCWEPKASTAEGIYIAQLKSDAGFRAVKMVLIK